MKSELNRIKNILQIMWRYYNIPAYLFHEICHCVVLVILYPLVECVHFDERTYFKFRFKNLCNFSIGCRICFDSKYKLVTLAIVLAPLFGWLLCFIYLLKIGSPLAWYFCLGPIMDFNLSEIDIQSIKETFKEKVEKIT